MILLVRHAECEGLGQRLNGRAEGVALTPEGRRQAARLADRIARERLREVRASPRQRCRETAAVLAASARAEVQICDDLDEVDFGAWTGRSFAELEADPAWRFWNEHRSLAATPQGERMWDVQQRMRRALEAAASLGNTVLVTHAETIRAALADLLGFSLDAWARLDIAPASITRIRAEAGALQVACVNEIAY